METYDVVVLGTGAAGLTAALAAAAAGASVAVFERGEAVGGTMALSGGVVWLPANPLAADAGVRDSRDDALTYLRSLSNGTMREDLLATFVDGVADLLDWLEKETPLRLRLVAGYPDYHPEHPGGLPDGGRSTEPELFGMRALGPWARRLVGDPRRFYIGDIPSGGGSGILPPEVQRARSDEHLEGLGRGLVAALLAGLLERGIEPRLGMRARELVVEEGRVVGVRLEGPDGPREVRAHGGVVLATGGFEWAAGLVRDFLRGPVSSFPGVATNTGDGLTMAMRVGTRLGGMPYAWWVPVVTPPGRRSDGEAQSVLLVRERTLPGTIMVNRRGERFTNEAANYNALGAAFRAFDVTEFRYANIPAWLILDGRCVARYGVFGTGPGQPAPKWLLRADSLEEMAGLIDVPAGVLQDTADRWNASVRDGRDVDFGRGQSVYDGWCGDRAHYRTPQATLGELGQPPFFATRVVPSTLGTKGGPATTTEGQVLDADGAPIPGLRRGQRHGGAHGHGLRRSRRHAGPGHGLRPPGRSRRRRGAMSAPPPEDLARSGLFEPIRIGTMSLRNRIMLPPHGRFTGDPFGSEGQARRNIAYWASRASDGAAWICGLNGFVDNSLLIPGFEPTGLGATTTGVFRLPNFRERAARYADAVHAGGACASVQLIMQGGMPHSPSGVLANPTNNQVPHVLTRDEIAWFVAEYAFSAGEARAAGLDGVELHANHEDLLQLFLSPVTNHRRDEYGSDLVGRTRFVREILAAIRAEVGAGFTVGVRLNADELFAGGYDLDGGLDIARALEATGTIDYLHVVVGNNWCPQLHPDPSLRVGRVGRVGRAVPGRARRPGRLQRPGDDDRRGGGRRRGRRRRRRRDGAGHVRRAATGDQGARRPPRRHPAVHRHQRLPAPGGARRHPVRLLGQPGDRPGGQRSAANGRSAAPGTRGRRRAGWAGARGAARRARSPGGALEREPRLGGQMRVAANARENAAYADFLDFQERRLSGLGVDVRCGHEATADRVLAADFDVVAVATGARPRRPAIDGIDGIDGPDVVEGRDVLLGIATMGQRVVVVAMEDHHQPLTVAGHLAAQGRQVTVLYPTPAVAPLVGKYSIGAPLARLTADGARIDVLQRVVRIEPGRVVAADPYSGTEREHTGVDTVVLACGGEAETTLFDDLHGRVEVHVVGDAYAPRRISYATRQAYELAARL